MPNCQRKLLQQAVITSACKLCEDMGIENRWGQLIGLSFTYHLLPFRVWPRSKHSREYHRFNWSVSLDGVDNRWTSDAFAQPNHQTTGAATVAGCFITSLNAAYDCNGSLAGQHDLSADTDKLSAT